MATHAFEFVPRILNEKTQARNKYRKAPTSSVAIGSSVSKQSTGTSTFEFEPTRAPTLTPTEPSTSSSNLKNSKLFSHELSLRTILELSLSDHSLWSNAALLRELDSSNDDEGYISIRDLKKFSSYFNQENNGIDVLSGSTFLRCARSSSLLECRLSLTGSGDIDNAYEGGWSGELLNSAEDDGLSGVEVRRRDWTKVREQVRRFTSFYWDSRTVYFENLPPNSRSVPDIHQFVVDTAPISTENMKTDAIQGIILPPHYKDPPDAPPSAKSKGFVFIIFSHVRHCDTILEHWPWDTSKAKAVCTCNSSAEVEGFSEAALDAQAFGFRCLSKKDWEMKKREYLQLKKNLVRQSIAPSGPPRKITHVSRVPEEFADRLSSSPAPQRLMPPIDAQSGADISTSYDQRQYPPNCLVFVKNIHPETNKTTLKSLFSKAVGAKADNIDYVDYTKGLDTCYLRLTSSAYAHALHEHFQSGRFTQSSALVDVCEEIKLDTTTVAISTEIVQGKKEDMYWQKLPEKIRRAALEKVRGDLAGNDGVEGRDKGALSGKKRKRRK